MMRTGHVALIGKPNVGKSTLLNTMVGQKVSIVSGKPQTTRRRVIGIAQGPEYQVVFVDTPGIHEPHTRLGRAMVEAARSALDGVDLVVFVVDGSRLPDEEDKAIAKMLKGAPVLVCLNKMDLLHAENVLENVEVYCKLAGTERYMMTVATRGDNVKKLLGMVVDALPEGEPAYGEDDFTDQTSRFMAGELVREKILRATRQEVPHATAVLVESWEEPEKGAVRISASIIVEKASQRAILIGRQGQFIKRIGTQARLEIEQLLDRQVFLELFVKVREDWRMNPRMLQELEYTE